VCEIPLAEVSFFPGNGARKNVLMRRGVDGFSPSSWEPQEEGMMSTAASFSLRKKPRFVSLGKSQYFRR
jgi:hypothetical protein